MKKKRDKTITSRADYEDAVFAQAEELYEEEHAAETFTQRAWEVATLRRVTGEHPSAIERTFGSSFSAVGNDLDLVARVIEFVNGNTDLTLVRDTYRFAIALEQGWSPPFDKNNELDDEKAAKQLARIVDETQIAKLIERDRAKARRVLHAAATDSRLLIKWISSWLQSHGSDTGIVRRATAVSDDRGDLRVTWRLDVDDFVPGATISKLLAYVAMLLFSDSAGCRSNLGVCHLASCGRLFNVRRRSTGRPNTKYCCTEHMEQQHQLGSTKRAQRTRARKKALAAMPRRRRHT